jgi:hypothetical protein
MQCQNRSHAAIEKNRHEAGATAENGIVSSVSVTDNPRPTAFPWLFQG